MSTGPPRVLLAALYWRYGEKHRELLSFEYYNMYLTLKEMYDTHFFDFYSIMLEKGKEAMNQELLTVVKRERPDAAIFALYKEEFIPEVIEELKQYTTTVCYFFDDMWRREFADRWTPHFHYVTTASMHRLRQYREMGYPTAIYSPFAFNERVYQRKRLPKEFDVSFVGGFHPYREWIVGRLRKAGLRVHVWGEGPWRMGGGKIAQEGMVDIFNKTRINLNISNSNSWDLRYLTSSLWAVRTVFGSTKDREQLKARHFEICGCGGFQLTYYVEGLEHCFDLGREVVVYMDVDDLIEMVRYYLKYEDERESIAEAGYRRTLAEHTYTARFRELMAQISQPTRPGEPSGVPLGSGRA
jgi:spore maturation protein CgeB